MCATLGLEPVCALVDSGSTVSLINSSWYYKHKNVARLPELQGTKEGCRSVSGEPLQVVGLVRCKLSIGKFSWPIEFWVVKGLAVELILGCDMLKSTQCLLDYAGGGLYFKFCPEERISFCRHQISAMVSQVEANRNEFDVQHLPVSQAERLLGLLREFPGVLSDRLGMTELIKYKIRLTDETPVRRSPYRLSPPKMHELRGIINRLLKDGVIRPSVSPYAAPVFLVPKSGGSGSRLVVDYRALNRKVVLESVPLPDIHNCFSWFAGAKVFSVLDLNQAYYQIPLDEESKPLTAFCTDYNLYEFNRVPFGLATGASVLSRLLDSVLGELKFKCVFNYLDDVVIYSASFEEHLEHLRKVLGCLEQAGLTVKPSKMMLAQTEISFLGHIVSPRGVSVDQSRTQAIYRFPRPRNKRDIARFIGMVNYFRKYIPRFAHIAAPLNLLRRKGARFSWGQEQQAAFEALKEALSNAPVLGIPDFNFPFVVQTDASNSGVAAVLLQEQGGERRPLAYASRALSETEAQYSVYELEALAVLYALEKFRFYLEHRRFKLETDNQALSWVLARPRKTGRVARWAVRISAFQFDIVHIKGSQNQVADALSRMFNGHEGEEERENSLSSGMEGAVGEPGGAQVAAVLTEIPALFRNLEEEQRNDQELGKIIYQLENGQTVEGYHLEKGLLCYLTKRGIKSKVCVPRSLVHAVFAYFHQSLCGGHLGEHKTKMKIQEHLTWKGMGAEIRGLVAKCQECKLGKPDTSGKKGFLHSTRELNPMDKLFADYLGPLPRTRDGNRYVLVVVDAFTRFVWLLPSKGATAAWSIHHLRSIFASFGPPKELVTDNAPGFTSRAFRGFCFGLGIRNITTTPYYPKPSFAERINRNLKSALIIYHSESQRRWDRSLGWLSLAFNTAYHEAHRTTPAKLMLSYEINSPLSNLWSLNDLLPERVDPEVMRERWEAARKNILLAHRRQAERYNRGRHAASVGVGDLVYVKNVWGESRAAEGVTGKMLPRFVGPCRVLEVLSPVNFLIENLVTGKRNKVHLSQVKLGGTRGGKPPSPPEGDL